MNFHDDLTLIAGFEHFRVAKYVFVASCLILFYDHALTFSLEVERVWKQRFTLATVLFIIIRYLTPLEIIVFILAFEDPALSTPLVCDGFVKFPGAAALTSIALIEVIMSLRTYALYGRNMLLLVCLLVLVAGQVGAMGILVHTGERVPFPAGLTACILTGKNAYLAAFWLSPLVTDTVIFSLTLYKTRRMSGQDTSLLRVILKDGIMYYVVICGVNLLNVLIYLAAPVDLKAVGATFSYTMATIMISRLVINLQGYRARQNPDGLETFNLHQTRDSGVLTTQFQFASHSLDIYANQWSIQNGSRGDVDAWLEASDDRLADERGMTRAERGITGTTEQQTIPSNKL